VSVQTTTQQVESRIKEYGAPRATVAFSGGVDSSVVLALAARALGRQSVTAVTAISPSYPAGELESAAEVARGVGVPFRTIQTEEVDREAYARNDGMRCFHCKTELYSMLARLAADADGSRVVMAGANADDTEDFRPGLLAAEQFGVRNPLLEAGIGKKEVRDMARTLGLPTADKPALACLSSRVAFGIRISPVLLGRIDRAEQMIRSLGFDQVRVRHLGETASVEVPAKQVRRLHGHRDWPGVIGRLRGLGWRDVQIDPVGYRQGSLNATMTAPEWLGPAKHQPNPDRPAR
jgi:pyridinium-3,5-biscarboxylic acid mononucleotide sulfurtransferase